MLTQRIPGTNIPYTESHDAFSVFRPMLEITGGLSLGQICKITDLQASTIQNWIKRGYVQRPERKKYYERHLSRLLLISSLRDCMNIEEIGELMVLINGDTEDTSDDIVSESKLYDYFCKAIKEMDDKTLEEKTIDEVVKKILKDEDKANKDRIACALKVMIYAFISGNCKRQINANLDLLRKK